MTTTPDADSLLARALQDAGAHDDEELAVRILDAAREVFASAGIQRSTMDDVARAAGVARVTVYRRFPTKDALVDQVVLREFRLYFERFRSDIRGGRTAADRVVLGFVSSLRAFRENVLIAGLMANEPAGLLVAVAGDGGRSLATVREFLAVQLRREQAAGNVSKKLDVDLAAEMMVRVAASFLMTPSHLLDLTDDRELTRVARQFLVPMLEPAPRR